MGFAVTYLGLLVLIPLAGVFIRASGMTWQEFWAVVTSPQVVATYKITFGISLLAAATNAVFGLIVAWSLVRYSFPGKRILDGMVDLPFALPTAVAGIALTTIYAETGILGQWFYAIGIVLATTFGTVPFIARELIPIMQAQGRDEEYAAMTLGASGWRTFFKVTLPNVKWGLFYGVILCNARAMGEFGGVEVVSGSISGKTSTMTLHIQTLYFSFATVPAFAMASVLALLALVTLVLKNSIEWWATKRG